MIKIPARHRAAIASGRITVISVLNIQREYFFLISSHTSGVMPGLISLSSNTYHVIKSNHFPTRNHRLFAEFVGGKCR